MPPNSFHYLTSPPPTPVEGDIFQDTGTGSIFHYLNGEWMEVLTSTPHLEVGESFDSCLVKHQTIIKELVNMVTILQLKIKALEEIVGTENRFKNIIRESQEGSESSLYVQDTEEPG